MYWFPINHFPKFPQITLLKDKGFVLSGDWSKRGIAIYVINGNLILKDTVSHKQYSCFFLFPALTEWILLEQTAFDKGSNTGSGQSNSDVQRSGLSIFTLGLALLIHGHHPLLADFVYSLCRFCTFSWGWWPKIAPFCSEISSRLPGFAKTRVKPV